MLVPGTIFLSNYPVEIVSTFCADSAHWRFYNKRLIKHALFIPRVNSKVLAKQISSLVNRGKVKKILNFFFKFFKFWEPRQIRAISVLAI